MTMPVPVPVPWPVRLRRRVHLLRATLGHASAMALAVSVLVAGACGGAAPAVERDAPPAGATAAGATDSPATSTAAERRATPRAGDSPPAAVARSRSDEGAGFGPGVGFRTRQRLVDHFEKHGHEFNAASASDYLRRAQRLRDAPVGGAILEIRRGDGSYSRFDRSSGAFLAFDANGRILTYFRPNDGEAYFRRQARRRAQP
jgi:hypothetical protein